MATAFSVSTCTSRHVLVALLLAVPMSACKPRAHAPDGVSHAQPATKASAPAAPVLAAPARPPAEEAFVIPDDAPIDPAEALQALRHDCCDEMPADQVKAHSGTIEDTAPSRAVQRRLTVSQPSHAR
jgi:hypothetical protein